MSNRLTNAQFASACNWATQRGRECGALGEGEWIGTAVAWSLSYLCVFDANGRMIDTLGSRCGTKRDLYERLMAIESAYSLLVVRQTVGLV